MSGLFSPALETVFSEGLRWFRGVISSDGEAFCESKKALSALDVDMTVSPDSGGGDSALGNSVVTVALLARFA